MKIYEIENGKTVKEIEVTNFIKEYGEYRFYVKDDFYICCDLFWINLYFGYDDYNGFYSLKRY